MNAKYTPDQINELLESDEPVFILRAQDMLAIPVLREYITNYKYYRLSTPEGVAKLEKVMSEFHDWEHKHPEKVKYPTL